MNYDSLNGIYYGAHGEIVPESYEFNLRRMSVTGGEFFENAVSNVPLIANALLSLGTKAVGLGAGAVSAPNAGAVRAANSARGEGMSWSHDSSGRPMEKATPRKFLFNAYQTKKEEGRKMLR